MQHLLFQRAGLYTSPCLPHLRASTISSPPLLSPSLPSSLDACCGSSQLGFQLSLRKVALPHNRPQYSTIVAFASYNYNTSQSELDDSAELAKRSQVSKRLESAARYFHRLGTLGFWGQLVCTIVSSVILAFSVAISGTPTAQATFYSTVGGITAAFLSVFWSYGYIRLSKRLRSTVHELAKAPPRADVVNNLKNGIIINILGMGLTLLGLQATIGVLVGKSLTSTAGPYLQGAPPGYSPVLALDVFLVQASANTILSHFLGLVFSLELLRSVTLSNPPPDSVIPKPA